MKLIWLLLLTTLSFGQTLGQGSTTFALVVPIPGVQDKIYDFTVCCGDTKPGGHLDDGFSYNNGEFSLEYNQKNPANQFTVSATIAPFNPDQKISPECVLISADLSNVVLTTTLGGTVSGMVGEYVQLFCVEDGVAWLGPGGVTIHAESF
jgi:hypothetical protein